MQQRILALLNQHRRSSHLLACLCVTLVLLGGCNRGEQIRRYQVARQKPSDRMLGAVIPQGSTAWFFKVVGPLEAIGQRKAEFRELIASVKFADKGPTWTLPEGWKQQMGTGIRFATLEIPTSEPPLEVTVTPLPMSAGDSTAYTLANVNRWRGELGLPAIAASELAGETEQIELDETTATLVDLQGKKRAHGGMSSAPLAGPTAAGPGPSSSPPPEQLSYKAPPEWTEGAVRDFRKAAFVVEHDGQRAEITISVLGGAGGDLLMNVNRWRGEIDLPPTTRDELGQVAQLQIGEFQADYVELVGAQETVLAAMLRRGGSAWFIKLKGPTELAAREKGRFESFAQSIRFQKAEGDGE